MLIREVAAVEKKKKEGGRHVSPDATAAAFSQRQQN
eukprot:COSAG06_NODE_4464_length_4229_cov_2.660291_3_plen_36_part_00